MSIQVLMPQLGESVVEGTITKWLKARGDHVEENEPLLEVNTDKVDTEVPSPAAGVLLEILVPEGTTVQAGAPLAWIGESGEAPGAAAPAPAPQAYAAAPQPQGAVPLTAAAAPVPMPEVGRNRDLGFISPVVARIASENGVDLFQVKGTGQGGRITKKDILAYMEAQKAAPVMPASPATVPAAAPQAPAPAPVAAEALPGKLLPLTAVRRSIAEHMLRSKHTSPHVTTIMEADMSKVIAHRQANKEAFAQDGVNLTFTAYFVSASVVALKAYPLVNSSWSDEGVILHSQVNIGMATSLGEAGLIVPVIKNADSLSLLGLTRAINDLSNRARGRQLLPDEVKGGTFTITNHGISGSLFATPIINQPQSAILGVGVIQKRVVVLSDATGDNLAIRPMAYLGLTFDHRIMDGVMADSFLHKIVETLQNWA